MHLFSYAHGNDFKNDLNESDDEYNDEPSVENEDFEDDRNKL